METIAKVLIVDDHPIVREGLTQLINRQKDLEVEAEAEEASDALKILAKRKIHLVITDISFQGMNGIDFIKSIKSRWPKLPVLVFSMHDEALYAERALHAGASGYLMKGESNNKMIAAIHRALTGEITVSQKITDKLLMQMSGKAQKQGSILDTLSNRELEVFNLIGQGFGTRQIADRLCLSIKTINTYREHLKGKLGLNNAVELTQKAVLWVQSKPSRP
jgi:DNA-binding NarL/FixJ family response regulator